MRTISSVSTAAIFTSLLAAAACGDGSGGSGGGGSGTTGTHSGGGGAAPAVAVAIDPASAAVLTCTKATFRAAVTGTTDTQVTWSASPGTIDEGGVYTAPLQVPEPASATITAQSHADATAKSDAAVTLATALPGAPVPITATKTTDIGVFQHQIAARGERLYMAYASGEHDVMVRRSDDAGKTWAAAVNAAPDADVAATCVALTVDAADPEVVYLVYRLAATAAYKALVPSSADSDAVVYGVSTDGGKTWTRHPMMLGGVAGGPYGGHNAAGICPDVASPAKDTVVVEWAGMYANDGNPDMYVFSDAQRGAGFATGQGDDWDWQCDGETGALATVARGLGLDVGQNGGSGSVTESPRLFTDGKGRLCVTWMGSGWTEPKDGVYLQCSSDLGKTFSAPLALTTEVKSLPHTPTGAFGPNGAVAVAWSAGDEAQGALLYVLSADGKTFSAPASIAVPKLSDGTQLTVTNGDLAYDGAGVLWVAYRAYDGGQADRIFADKSCDGGKTWSGAALLNGPEGAIVHARHPGLVITSTAASVLSYTNVGATEGMDAQLTRLVP